MQSSPSIQAATANRLPLSARKPLLSTQPPRTTVMETNNLVLVLLQPKFASLILLALASAVWWLAFSYQRSQKYLRQYPWVGVDKRKWFGLLRGAAASFRHAAQFGLEGYTKVRGRRFLCVVSSKRMLR